MTFIGFRLVALTGIPSTAILLIANDHIGSIFSTNAGVVAMTGSVLLWVAAYHAADALQTVCVFVLQCYRITVAPLVVLRIVMGSWPGRRLLVGLPANRSLGDEPLPYTVLGSQRIGIDGHGSPVCGHALAGRQPGSTKPRSRFAGKVTEKTDPLPKTLAMSNVAPWRCSTCLTIARPSPVPPVSRERLRSTR
jgi:hypothetical protein